MIQSDILIYLLEMSICLAAFYGLYLVAFRRESYFQWNRAYLISALVLAALIPALHIQLATQAGESAFELIEPVWSKGEQISQFVEGGLANQPNRFELTKGDAMIGIYAIGALIMGLIFMKSLFQVFQVVRKHRKVSMENATLIDTSNKFPATSFFSFVFWNGDHVSEDDSIVFEHELVHVKQYHSLDVILMELFVIAKWFNPLIYLFKRQLKLTHEFIADEYVAKKIGSKETYANTLLRHSGTEVPGLYHAFSGSLVPRLKRLATPASSSMSKLKYLTVFPMIFGLMGLFSFNISESSPLDQNLQMLGDRFERFSSDVLIQFEDTKKEATMRWAGKEVPLVAISEQANIEFPFHVFSKTDFKKFQTQIPLVYQENGALMEVEKVRISITGSDYRNFYNLECPGDKMDCLHEALEGMSASSSIQLVFFDENDRQYYCILTDDNETLYVPNYWMLEDPFIFDRPETLRSYGVERMSRKMQGYEFFWGPGLKFNVTAEEIWYPVSIEQLEEAANHLPALAPSWGGLFDKFSFKLVKVRLNEETKEIALVADENDESGFINHPQYKELFADLRLDDMLYIEQIKLGDGQPVGSFRLKVVEDPDAHWRRKWNMATFNFNNMSTSRFQSSFAVEPDEYVLKWGTVYIPLEHYASPKHYQATLKLEASAFENVVGFPIEVYKNDELLASSEVERSLDLVYFDRINRRLNTVSKFEDEGDIKLKNNGLSSLKKVIYPGMSLTIHGKLAGIDLNSISVQIIDPDGPADPPVSIYRNRQYSAEEFSFQVIQGIGSQKTVIKIDSFAESSKDILNMYRDDTKYEIVQIPGFRTTRRLLNPDMKSIDSKAKVLTDHEMDLKRLSEFTIKSDDQMMAEWGRMIANPASGQYSSKEFRSSSTWPIVIRHNARQLEVEQMEVKIFSGDKLTHHVKLGELPNAIFTKAIQSMTGRGTVFVTNVVIKENGDSVILPQDFVFSME